MVAINDNDAHLAHQSGHPLGRAQWCAGMELGTEAAERLKKGARKAQSSRRKNALSGPQFAIEAAVVNRFAEVLGGGCRRRARFWEIGRNLGAGRSLILGGRRGMGGWPWRGAAAKRMSGGWSRRPSGTLRFAELYDRHFERVYAFIARRIHRREDVQDLTADVFHQALAGLGRFEWRGAPFAAWLLRIAANAVIDRGRRLAKEHDNPASDIEEIQSHDPVEQLEEQARLFRLVHALPADQRSVILARFVEQRSIREMAVQLGRTEGAVKQLQFRALKNLRARMEDADG